MLLKPFHYSAKIISISTKLFPTIPFHNDIHHEMKRNYYLFLAADYFATGGNHFKLVYLSITEPFEKTVSNKARYYTNRAHGPCIPPKTKLQAKD